MNKARHDLETKITDEIEKNRALVETNRRKEESILSKQNEIEDMDKKIIDLERNIETVEVKLQGVQRQSDLAKKQLQDKIQSLSEAVASEKQTRDMWVERFEKEQKEHSKTQTELLGVRSELKDSQLVVKTGEIKIVSSQKQIQLI